MSSIIVFWSANGNFLKLPFLIPDQAGDFDTVLETHHFSHKILQLITRPRKAEEYDKPGKGF